MDYKWIWKVTTIFPKLYLNSLLTDQSSRFSLQPIANLHCHQKGNIFESYLHYPYVITITHARPIIFISGM